LINNPQKKFILDDSSAECDSVGASSGPSSNRLFLVILLLVENPGLISISFAIYLATSNAFAKLVSLYLVKNESSPVQTQFNINKHIL
jgi:hypothetical protein